MWLEVIPSEQKKANCNQRDANLRYKCASCYRVQQGFTFKELRQICVPNELALQRPFRNTEVLPQDTRLSAFVCFVTTCVFSDSLAQTRAILMFFGLYMSKYCI